MTELTNQTIAEALEGLKKKAFSAVELTQAHIQVMELTRHLNAYITETPEKALEAAKESDKRIAAGKMGALEGIPIGMKDLFCTKGVRTTAASKILGNFVPEYESTVSGKMLADSNKPLCKTNL